MVLIPLRASVNASDLGNDIEPLADENDSLLATKKQPKPRKKRGPPLGHQNAVKHGCAPRKRDAIQFDQLPPGCEEIGKILWEFHNSLKKIVLEKNEGQINLAQSGAIDSACMWERHRLLCLRWLHAGFAEMTWDQRRQFSLDAARASGSRDACLKGIGLSVDDFPADPTQQNVSTKFGITLEEIRAPFTDSSPPATTIPPAPPADPSPAS